MTEAEQDGLQQFEPFSAWHPDEDEEVEGNMSLLVTPEVEAGEAVWERWWESAASHIAQVHKWAGKARRAAKRRSIKCALRWRSHQFSMNRLEILGDAIRFGSPKLAPKAHNRICVVIDGKSTERDAYNTEEEMIGTAQLGEKHFTAQGGGSLPYAEAHSHAGAQLFRRKKTWASTEATSSATKDCFWKRV